jgi:hypothetical protein
MTITKKVKRSTTGKLSKGQLPYFSPELDREYLRAHDDSFLVE